MASNSRTTRKSSAAKARGTTPPTAPAMFGNLDAQRCIIDQSLSKAAGVMFVLAELQKRGGGELTSQELEGFALWAVEDFINDARTAVDRLFELEHAAGKTPQ
jgi:hypothetical protein